MSEQKIFFSVIIPAYNVGPYIGSTIQSVLNQTFSDFEILVIDDGSTDNTPEIVSNIKDERIRLIKKKNGGVSSARNMGMALSKGQYIAWLDGDDIWHSQHLELAYLAFKKYPSCNWYASKYIYVTQVKQEQLTKYKTLNASILSYFRVRQGTIGSDSNIMKRICIPSKELFPVGMKYAEDLCAWSYYAIYNNEFIYNKSTTAYYLNRDSSAMNTFSREKQILSLKEEYCFYKKIMRIKGKKVSANIYCLYQTIFKFLRYKYLSTNNLFYFYLYRFTEIFFNHIIFRV